MVLILLTVATFMASVLAMLRRHAPSNVLIRWILTRRGLRWATPVSVAAVAAYAALAVLACGGVDAGGPPILYLAVVVGLYNAVRFAVLIPLATTRLFLARRREARAERGISGSVRPWGAPSPLADFGDPRVISR